MCCRYAVSQVTATGEIVKSINVAIVSYPFPAFVNPTLPVVATLVRRGYRVSYATTKNFAQRVENVGAEVIQIPVPPSNGSCGNDDEAYNEFVKFNQAIAETVPGIARTLAANPPNLLL